MKKILCIALLLLGISPFAVASERHLLISLGTGGITGVYYPAGGAICRLLNQTRKQHGIRCAVRSTPGSVANINNVNVGALDLGLAESGWLYQAWSGRGHFADQGQSPQLRTLLTLFPEYLTVLARPDSGIRRFSDIRNKRISIGLPGTSQRSTMNALMKSNNWGLQDFAVTLSLGAADQAGALCEGRIDVMIYTVGLPSGATKEAARDCGGQLIAVASDQASELIRYSPHYLPMVINAGVYPDNWSDTPTVGVNATFFTSAELPDEIAYTVVRTLFEQLEQFRTMHPAFVDLKPAQMVKGPYPAPLHPGAERYFREAGWL
ncbi:MAG: TAXI family TRAP transporter solute-binding subunit [Marinobacterium sp.]|nr:TAXI family TRAP transporter solute-binding subunit [Marinobacterium sp.]